MHIDILFLLFYNKNEIFVSLRFNYVDWNARKRK